MAPLNLEFSFWGHKNWLYYFFGQFFWLKLHWSIYYKNIQIKIWSFRCSPCPEVLTNHYQAIHHAQMLLATHMNIFRTNDTKANTFSIFQGSLFKFFKGSNGPRYGLLECRMRILAKDMPLNLNFSIPSFNGAFFRDLMAWSVYFCRTINSRINDLLPCISHVACISVGFHRSIFKSFKNNKYINQIINSCQMENEQRKSFKESKPIENSFWDPNFAKIVIATYLQLPG